MRKPINNLSDALKTTRLFFKGLHFHNDINGFEHVKKSFLARHLPRFNIINRIWQNISCIWVHINNNVQLINYRIV